MALAVCASAITAMPAWAARELLPIPVVYNGWVQNLPASWKNLLTAAQCNPVP